MSLGIARNMRLRNKILLLVAVPFAALTLFAFILISDNKSLHDHASGYEKVVRVALNASALVHELQKERGASAGYLSSKGAKFGDIVTGQRKQTNTRLASYRETVSQFDLQSIDKGLGVIVEAAQQQLSVLEPIRDKVTSQGISVAEQVGFYTDLNARLLDISDYLARISPDSEIANRAAAFSTFLQSKERAGLERAVLSSVFASDAFAPNQYSQFADLVNTQNIYLTVFSDMASEAQVKFFDEQMSHRSVGDVQRMRDIAVANRQSGGFNVDSVTWFDTITQKINQLKNVEDYLGSELHKKALATRDLTVSKLKQSVSVFVIAILLSLILVFLVSREVLHSIYSAMQLADAISKGDLTQKVSSSSRDEAGQLLMSLNAMQTKLSEIITTSQGVAVAVQMGASEISTSSIELRTRTQSQGENLERTASSTEEISSTVKQNAVQAQTVNDLSRKTSDQAIRGGEVVGKAVIAMDEINEASRKIASITGVINEIAFQTNLLALNAAVEAARAGEQGRGFAVVATEVRQLAGRSATAAKEISVLIQDCVAKVDSGSSYVNESGDTLKQIVGSVKQVNDLIADIANASQEQAIGVDAINQSMANIDQITQTNTQMVSTAAQTSQTIGQKANELSDTLSFFKVSP